MSNKSYITITIIFISILFIKLLFYREIGAINASQKGLQLVNIACYAAAIASWLLVKLKPVLSKFFIVLLLILTISESAWKFCMGDIELYNFIFLMFGFTFFCFALWTIAQTELDLIKEKKSKTITGHSTRRSQTRAG